ncbi:1-acyl-sn-glycerol-3-phosphate acyltransferase [Candidatus Saccharibacteria bacterium]|nr:1-acyl-sn-glycerol-3-phosphate acyltransferase [Candidatus Saccharibacteria bacterium]
MNIETQNTEQAKRKRLKRLKSATGVAYPTGYYFFRGIVINLARVFMKAEIYNEQNIPQPGGIYYRPKWYRRSGDNKIDDHAFVIAANHGKIWDIPFVGLFHRGLVWICKPAFCRNWLFAMVNQRMGAVPIFRPSIDGKPSKKNTPGKIEKARLASYTAEEGLDVAVEALWRGVPVEMFPEGTRVGKEVIDYSKSGTARIARRSGCAILPIALAGCAKGDPVVRRGILRRQVIVGVVCPPIYPSDYGHLAEDSEIDKALMSEWQVRINKGRQEALDILRSH